MLKAASKVLGQAFFKIKVSVASTVLLPTVALANNCSTQCQCSRYTVTKAPQRCLHEGMRLHVRQLRQWQPVPQHCWVIQVL